MDIYKTCHEIIQPYGFFGSYAIKSCIFQQLAISMTQLIYPVTGKVSFESDLRWNPLTQRIGSSEIYVEFKHAKHILKNAITSAYS